MLVLKDTDDIKKKLVEVPTFLKCCMNWLSQFKRNFGQNSQCGIAACVCRTSAPKRVSHTCICISENFEAFNIYNNLQLLNWLKSHENPRSIFEGKIFFLCLKKCLELANSTQALKRTIPLWILPIYLTCTILAAYLITEFIEKPCKDLFRSRER